MRKTVIVVPCFNEAKRLDGPAFLEFGRDNPNCSFLFVDDGSTDATGRILAELCHHLPQQLSFLSLGRNRGKAEAVRQGFLKAFALAPAYVGFWDADLSTPLATIATFCQLLESPEINMVCGARVKLVHHAIERRMLRHYLGRIFATCATLVLGLAMYDTQCGAKIFRNNDKLRHVFADPFSVNWAFDVEILARYLLLPQAPGDLPFKKTVVEYPLPQWIDKQDSRMKPFDFARTAMELLTIWRHLHSGKRHCARPLPEQRPKT